MTLDERRLPDPPRDGADALDSFDAPDAPVTGQLAFPDFEVPVRGAAGDGGERPGVDGDPAGADRDGWRLIRRAMVALVIVGLAARLADLGGRPLHHDEGLDAWFSWRYLNGTYDGYDPVYHGPLRFYVTAGFFWLFGESDATTRLLAALSGSAVVFLPWVWRRDLGRTGTLAAIGLLAISPSMLYFSRVGREDAFFLALTFGAVLTLIALLRNPRVWHPALLLALLVAAWAVKESIFLNIFVFGSLGMVLLAQEFATGTTLRAGTEVTDAAPDLWFRRATLLGGLVLLIMTLSWIGLDPEAESFVVQLLAATDYEIPSAGGNPTFLKLGLYGVVLAALMGLGVVIGRRNGLRPQSVPLVRNLARPGVVGWSVAAAAAVGLFVVLFTQFLQDFDGPNQPAPPDGQEDTRSAPYGALGNGLLAGLRYWLGEQDTVRGDSRWQYYLAVVPAYEWFILALAVVGIVAVVRRPTLVGQTLVWWGVASLALHSWAGERMPWLIIHPLLPFVLLAGVGCQVLWAHRASWWRVPVGAAFGAGLVWTVVASYQAAYERGGEPQELFVQAGQATPEVPEWTDRLERLDQLTMAELGRHVTVSIDADVYWPYGWYLRDFPGGTYADISADGDPPDSDVVFVPHWEQESVGGKLEGYVALPYEHRWWWVPDFDVSVGDWAAWLWDRDPWRRDGPDSSDCPGSLVGQVFVRAEVYELEQRFYGGAGPPTAPTPDYEGPCRRAEHLEAATG